MPSETLTHDQASELYARLAREAAGRNSRARRLRLVTQSGAVVALAVVLAVGAGLATDRGHHGSVRRHVSYPRLHPLKSTASPEAIRNASPRAGFGPLVWQPRWEGNGDENTVAMSLAGARARAKYPVLAPSSVLPDASIKNVWLRDTGPFPSMVAIVYEHLEITEAVGEHWDPSYYRGMVGDDALDPGAHLGTAQGETAYLAPPHTDMDGIPHPGDVDFVKNGVRIRVIGFYPEKELLMIANSLE